MAYSPDKAYQAAQVYAARDIVSKIESDLVVLHEARFFVDTDTMRDIIDLTLTVPVILILRSGS